MIKPIFLDFDGVLNSHQWILMQKSPERPEPMVPSAARTLQEADYAALVNNLDPHIVWNLRFILQGVPEAKLVISSSWRRQLSLEQIKAALAMHGIPQAKVIGKTPDEATLSGSRRRSEIGSWLTENKGTYANFAVLDDARVYDDGELPGFFRTDQMVGLTYRDACMVIQHLNPEWRVPCILI